MSKRDSLISKRDKLQEQIAELVSEERASLRKQIKALDRLSGRGHRRTMSRESRKRISLAQKKRWASKK